MENVTLEQVGGFLVNILRGWFAREKLFVMIGTHNHRQYIAQSIEGAIAQQVDLPIQILIRDDASTDGTAEVVAEYARKYRHLIHPVLLDISQHSRGRGWFQPLLRHVIYRTGFTRKTRVYLALCEGDDYWSDATKLQRQVDFLRANKQVAMVHHRVRPELVPGADPAFYSKVLQHESHFSGMPSIRTGAELDVACPIFTCSVLIRLSAVKLKSLRTKPPKVLGDWSLFALARSAGMIGFLGSKMSVYRVSSNGVFSGATNEEREARMAATAEWIASLKGSL